MNKTELAFRWIYGLLADRQIPYVVSGGFAVRLLGGSRPLYDMDLDIPEDRFEELLPSVLPYLVSGPERFRDERFDILLLTLEYHGQLMDLTGAESIRLFDVREQVWRDEPTDVEAYTIRQAYGLPVRLQRPDLLIRYKNMIARPTDLEDVRTLEKLAHSLRETP